MIQGAMGRDRLGSLIPEYIENPSALDESVVLQIQAKRLTRENLTPILESVINGGYLLRQHTSQEQHEPTMLVRKLVAGGAQSQVVEDAKLMRANASQRDYERAAATLYDDKKRNDVRIRLKTLANATVQRHCTESQPALTAWAEVLNQLGAQAATLDPHRVYDRDQFLLLGAVCDLTDECFVAWGVPIA